MDIAKKIEDVLRAGLDIKELIVENQSYLHRGHAGDDGTDQTHFLVKVVSPEFKGMSRVSRQRLVFSLLQHEMKFIHALSLDLQY